MGVNSANSARKWGYRLPFAISHLTDWAALASRPIDAAISAISVTPERDAVVDFSNIYYVSEDAILAQADSQFAPIERVGTTGSYTVGVQTGTVYQRWLQDTRSIPD